MPRSRSRRCRKNQPLPFKFYAVVIGCGLLILLCAEFLGAAAHAPWLLFVPLVLVLAPLGGWWWFRVRSNQLRAMQAYTEQQNRLVFAQNIGSLLSLTPREFELTIVSLLQAYGYRQVQHTGSSGDLAADLHAISPQGEYVVVQCKRYAPGQRVGSPDIQKFLGMVTIHHRAQRGIFVTTSSFTAPAQALAQQHHVELIDGQQLTAMFAQVNGADGYPQISS